MDYKFIGWCQEDKHDKIWGVICLESSMWGGNYVTFWGRRGAKLQTKIFKDANDWDMEKLIRVKSKKGYTGINRNSLDLVYPDFQIDLEQTAFWAQLKI